MSNMHNHKHISEDFCWFAEFRKLRRWCLAEGEETFNSRLYGKGPFKKIVRAVQDDEFTQISVECSVTTEAMEIEIRYWTESLRDGKWYNVHNPAIMVAQDGNVYRTHGDFNRVLPWFETLKEV